MIPARTIRASAASRCGPSRARNEDAAVLGEVWVRDGAAEAEWRRDEAPRAFVAGVLDGLGGHLGGDEASARVARRLTDAVRLWSAGCTADELRGGLMVTLTDAHRELNGLAAEDPSRAGCGTTCTALAATAQALVLVHVGDSRCYRRRDGIWKPMTLDQVVTQRDVQGQPISRLAYAVGAGLRDLPPELVEDLTEKCFAGDVYVLVTDGVTGAAGSDEALTAALEAPDASGLLDLALAQGGPDNATAVRLELLP